jgi:hypothetical protein
MEQSIGSDMKPVRDWHGVDARIFAGEIEPLNRPAVLRNLVAHWPDDFQGFNFAQQRIPLDAMTSTKGSHS